MCQALEVGAEKVGAKSITAVAVAYVMQKTPYVFPIVGGRKVEHLMDNLEALEIVLTEEHIKYLESVLPFDVGFPQNPVIIPACLRLLGTSINDLCLHRSAQRPRRLVRPSHHLHESPVNWNRCKLWSHLMPSPLWRPVLLRFRIRAGSEWEMGRVLLTPILQFHLRIPGSKE